MENIFFWAVPVKIFFEAVCVWSSFDPTGLGGLGYADSNFLVDPIYKFEVEFYPISPLELKMPVLSL